MTFVFTLICGGFPIHVVRAIQNLYAGTTIRVDLGKGRLSEEITINQDYRQNYSLSPSLFNMYIDEILRK